ncbi:zeta toxin family protein [Lactobacillus amylovorus]|uniref:zeta toxin family protein n=1 Tax=Lactobacillus amylovorus TaxID=1604 RepID=UPI003F92AC3B
MIKRRLLTKNLKYEETIFICWNKRSRQINLYLDGVGPSIENSVRINADEIAREKGWDWRDPKTNAKALLLETKKLQKVLKTGQDINLETTLAGHEKNILKLLDRVKKNNYQIVLLYVGVSSPDIAVERVKERVAKGGHGVPEELIRKRYYESLNNLNRLISKFDIVKIYDNSKNFRILYQRIETEVKLCRKDIPQWVQSIIIQDKVN